MPRLLQSFFLPGIALVAVLLALASYRGRGVMPVKSDVPPGFTAASIGGNTSSDCNSFRLVRLNSKPSDRTQDLNDREPATAWRAALALLPDDNSTWQAVLARLAQNEPMRALKNAAQLARDKPELAQIAYEAVLDTLAQGGNYAAARQVLEQIPNGEIKNHLITNLTLQWGHDDPLGAADWLLGFSNDIDRVPAFAQLGRTWAEVQPQEAAEILFQLPAGELRRSALTAALLAWIDKNPAAASAWLAQLEPHPDLDLVAARIARVPSLVRTHVEVALGWAETISDANERVQALGSIVIQWADTDRSGAVRYVQNSPGLTSAQRATLLEDIGTEHGVL